MPKLDHYISVGRDRLRCGYTTGTCAAAAARGAAEALLLGRALPAVRINTPAGVWVEAELLEQISGPGWASCAVRKDGGDDPDVTDGALVSPGWSRRPRPALRSTAAPAWAGSPSPASTSRWARRPSIGSPAG